MTAQSDAYDPEDFPTKQQLIQALGLASFLALAGFVFSYLLFVHHAVTIKITPIDRRAAEGAPAAYADQGQGSKMLPVGDGYVSGDLSRVPKAERRRILEIIAPKINKPIEVAAANATPTPTPTARALDLPEDPNLIRHPNTVHVAPKPAASNTTVAAAAVLSVARPPLRSWPEAWNASRLALVQFASVDGAVCAGVIVDRTGLLIACNSKLPSDAMGRVMMGGSVNSATVVSRDLENDLVMLRLPPGDYPFLPLAPDGGAAGETLLSPTGSDPSQYLDCKVTSSSGSLFMYRGVIQPSSAGGGLINARGELVGVSLGQPYAFGGSSLALCAKASAVQKLMSSPSNPTNSRSGGGDERLSQMLATMVTPIEARPRPSQSNAKILPGEAVGNYPLGITRNLVISELGAGTPVKEGSGFVQLQWATPHLIFTFCQDRAVAIETDYSFYATSNGLSVGSPYDVARLRSLLPDLLTGSTGGHALAAGSGLEVESHDNKVSFVRVVPK